MFDYDNINSRNSLHLFNFNEEFDFLKNTYNSNKFPKALILSGKKGSGKSTLINHFMTYVFDEQNYDLKDKIIDNTSNFFKQNYTDSFPNIIYLSGDNFNKIKVEDIRKMKSMLTKTTAINKQRFIILDDVETFNHNSLNALLKMIEEPTTNNSFILINNKTKPLLETVNSRCLEIKIALSNKRRIEIIESLLKDEKDFLLNHKDLEITPGVFLIFNKLCKKNSIDLNGNFLENLNIFLTLYRKEKNKDYINLIRFLTDVYFNKLLKKNVENFETINEKRIFVLENIDKFTLYHLNQNSLINAIENKISYG